MRYKNQNTGEKQFIVDFMNWNTFLDAILERTHHQETWDAMAQADCMIGGLDYSLSYMYVKLLTKFYKPR
jgi:hypothetical protein